MKHFSSHFKPQPGWYFLTGSRENIDLIRRKLGVWDPEEKKVEHMNVLTIGNEAQARWLDMESVAKPDDISTTVMRMLKMGVVKASVVKTSAVQAKR